MPDPRDLIRELHRRSVWQVLAVYAVASWIVLQVVDVLVQNFGLPGWFPAFALALLLVGLPLVLATALVQEGGPGGRSERDPTLLPSDPEAAAPGAAGAGDGSGGGSDGLRGVFTWERTLTAGVLATALWGVVAAGWIAFGGGAAVGGGPGEGGGTGSARDRVVVLPFENLGPEEEEYFADGITEEITSRLVAVEELGVISRTTAMQYKESGKTLKEIGAELGVDYVLEGTVRWAGGGRGPGQVRVTPQLIRVSDDTHVWSDRYDRDLEEIFRIQSEIARRVVDEMGAALGAGEERLVDARPTSNMEAYDHYLRALDEYTGGYGEENLRGAVSELREAVELDPGFVQAWARLSSTHSFIYFLGHDRTEARLRRSKEAVDRALELDSDHPGAHAALGFYHYRGFLDYGRALEEFEYASERLPNAAGLLSARAYVRRRQGRFEEAAELLERSFALNPRHAGDAYELGATYQYLRRWDDAARVLDRATELQPEWGAPYLRKASVALARTGEVDSAAAIVDRLAARVGEEAEAVRTGRTLGALARGDYREALRLASEGGDAVSQGQYLVSVPAFRRGRILHWMGRAEAARSRFDSARVVLEELRAEEEGDGARVLMPLARVHAYLGHDEEALELARRAADLYPPERDAVGGKVLREVLAEVQAATGERDAAVATLEALLEGPSTLTRRALRHHPAWGPVRDHPGFRALVDGTTAEDG